MLFQSVFNVQKSSYQLLIRRWFCVFDGAAQTEHLCLFLFWCIVLHLVKFNDSFVSIFRDSLVSLMHYSTAEWLCVYCLSILPLLSKLSLKNCYKDSHHSLKRFVKLPFVALKNHNFLYSRNVFVMLLALKLFKNYKETLMWIRRQFANSNWSADHLTLHACINIAFNKSKISQTDE